MGAAGRARPERRRYQPSGFQCLLSEEPRLSMRARRAISARSSLGKPSAVAEFCALVEGQQADRPAYAGSLADRHIEIRQRRVGCRKAWAATRSPGVHRSARTRGRNEVGGNLQREGTEAAMIELQERELLADLSRALETGRNVEDARQALRAFYSQLGMY